jgi:hypothetical protein
VRGWRIWTSRTRLNAQFYRESEFVSLSLKAAPDPKLMFSASCEKQPHPARRNMARGLLPDSALAGSADATVKSRHAPIPWPWEDMLSGIGVERRMDQ